MERPNLADTTGYTFGNAGLLRQALTHGSFGAPHNERLEFLGDGILTGIIAAVLFERFPQSPEGELTRLRASLVNEHSLYAIAQRMELGSYLLLGEGELKSGGRQRPSILANALEALIGAVFLDGGFDAARAVVLRLFEQPLKIADPQTLGKDAKTSLQELLQARRMAPPKYSVVATAGREHERRFCVECVIPELNIRTQGEGGNRQSAEQAAARRAYDLGKAL